MNWRLYRVTIIVAFVLLFLNVSLYIFSYIIPIDFLTLIFAAALRMIVAWPFMILFLNLGLGTFVAYATCFDLFCGPEIIPSFFFLGVVFIINWLVVRYLAHPR